MIGSTAPIHRAHPRGSGTQFPYPKANIEARLKYNAVRHVICPVVGGILAGLITNVPSCQKKMVVIPRTAAGTASTRKGRSPYPSHSLRTASNHNTSRINLRDAVTKRRILRRTSPVQRNKRAKMPLNLGLMGSSNSLLTVARLRISGVPIPPFLRQVFATQPFSRLPSLGSGNRPRSSPVRQIRATL